VKHRSRHEINREDFEQLTLEQLKAETSKYGLLVARDKRRMIDAIMNHLERNAPASELFLRTTSEQALLRTTRQETPEEENREPHGTTVSLQQIMIVVQQQQ